MVNFTLLAVCLLFNSISLVAAARVAPSVSADLGITNDGPEQWRRISGGTSVSPWHFRRFDSRYYVNGVAVTMLRFYRELYYIGHDRDAKIRSEIMKLKPHLGQAGYQLNGVPISLREYNHIRLLQKRYLSQKKRCACVLM